MAYVPPHRRAAAEKAAALRDPTAPSLASLADPPRAAPHAPPPSASLRSLQDLRSSQHANFSSQDMRSSSQGVRSSSQDVRPSQDARSSSQDVRPSQDARSSSQDVRSAQDVRWAADARRERPHRAQGAPSRFGSVGRAQAGGLREGEDVARGARVDEEGMVYEMADGSVCFFADRERKYLFTSGPEALPVFRGLLATNKRVFSLSRQLVEGTPDPSRTYAEGEKLYREKPTMRQHHGAKGTWSDEEYAHPGLQHIYLRLKSIQRTCESWALYERCAERGVFDRYLRPDTPLRVASLGGGPGYELLALEWFLTYWRAARSLAPPQRKEWLRRATFGEAREASDEAAPPPLELVSLDLQASWEPFVRALSTSGTPYCFKQWDMSAGVDAVDCSGLAALDLCIISNVLVHCTDERTADVLASLLSQRGVHAILLNERGATQHMIEMVESRGVVVVRLMSQEAGRDDRQLLFLPPGTSVPQVCPEARQPPLFPNVPYEENKHR